MQGKGMEHGCPWREAAAMDGLLCKNSWPLKFPVYCEYPEKKLYISAFYSKCFILM